MTFDKDLTTFRELNEGLDKISQKTIANEAQIRLLGISVSNFQQNASYYGNQLTLDL